MKRDALAVLFLLLVVAVAHGAVSAQWWLWDDPQLLYGAMRFRALDHFTSPQAWQQQSTANFVPMLMLANEIDLGLFGVEPRGFYLHHLFVFALAMIAVYVYLRTFTSELIAAAAAGTLALSQPAFTVATLLMDRHYAAGLLVAMVAMILFRRDRPLLGALVYFLACLEKEVYVPLPLLVVVQDLVTRRGWRVALRDGALCGVSTAAYVAWRIHMLGSFGGYGGGESSLGEVVTRGWTIATGTRGLAALGVLAFAVFLAVKRASWQTAMVLAACAIVGLIPIAGLTSLDSRYFFVAVAMIVILAAIAARTRLEQLVFVALCVAIAVGGIVHGLRLRRDLGMHQRDGLYVWTAPSTAPVLFTGANGWYIEGIQWLRRTVKGEAPPRVIASIPGLVIARERPPADVRAAYDIVRAHAAGDMPLTVELSRRGSRFSWKLGPEAKGDAFFFVTPIQELVWTRTASGWVRLPADVRVPTATFERDRKIRVMRRSGDRWTVSAELPMPEDGKTIRWVR